MVLIATVLKRNMTNNAYTNPKTSSKSEVSFLDLLFLDSLSLSFDSVLRLRSEDTTTPGLLEVFVVVVVGVEEGDEVLELSLVFVTDFSESNSGSSLLVDQLAEGSLTY